MWKLITIGILVWGLQFFESRSLSLAATGYRRSGSWPAGEAHRRTRKAVVGLGAAAILNVPLSFLGTSERNPSAYGPVRHASLALVLAQLLVCYPLTVVAEEASSADGFNLDSGHADPLQLHCSGRVVTSNSGGRSPH